MAPSCHLPGMAGPTEPMAAGSASPVLRGSGYRRVGDVSAPPPPEEEDDPSGITSLKNRWKSPNFWVTAVSRVTTVPRALGIRQRESNALHLILFFFLQCRTKEVGSSFVQNTLLPCVQQVLCYRSAAQLHPFARLQRAQHGCTSPRCTAGKALSMGQGTGGSSSHLWGSTPCLCRPG